jgi:hypothetical protein
MTRKEAMILIAINYPKKTMNWVHSQLSRIEDNLDGEVEDYSEIISLHFNINQ